LSKVDLIIGQEMAIAAIMAIMARAIITAVRTEEIPLPLILTLFGFINCFVPCF
jgi:hypothetical protein